jgi:hypothetical protein
MKLPTKERAIAALYQWLTFGVGLVGLLMGIASFCMNATTLATVKGIYVPMWQVPIVFLIILLGCVFIGWAWDHFQFWSAVNSRSNDVQNPQFKELCEDIKKIKEKMEIK